MDREQARSLRKENFILNLSTHESDTLLRAPQRSLLDLEEIIFRSNVVFKFQVFYPLTLEAGKKQETEKTWCDDFALLS